MTVVGHKRRPLVMLRSLGFIFVLAAQRGLPFLALPLLARSVPQDEFGNASLAVAAAAVLSVFVSLGLNAALPRLYHQEPESGPQAWAALFRVQLVVALVTTLVGLMLGTVFSFVFPASVAPYVFPTALLASVASIQSTLLSLAVARSAGWIAAISGIVQLALGLGAVALLSGTFGGVGYVLAVAIAGVGSSLVFATLPQAKPAWDRPRLRQAFTLSAPFVGQGLSSWLLSLSDRVVIGVLLGAADLGVYQVSYMMGSLLAMVLEGIQAAWAPRYYRSRHVKKSVWLRTLVVPSLAFAGSLAVTVPIITPPVFAVLAPGYEIDFLVTAIVALSALPRALYFISIARLLDQGRSLAIMTSTVASGVLTVGGLAALVPAFGIAGAAFTTLAAFVLQALMVGLSGQGITPVRDLGLLAVFLAAGAVAAYGASLVARHNAMLDIAITAVLTLTVIVSSFWFARRLTEAIRAWA